LAEGTRENIATSDRAVEDCLKQYGAKLKAAFSQAEEGVLTTAKLAYVARETGFIVCSASGAFPPIWWHSVPGQE